MLKLFKITLLFCIVLTQQSHSCLMYFGKNYEKGINFLSLQTILDFVTIDNNASFSLD